MDMELVWDVNGNLHSRNDAEAGNLEVFDYDRLNRLTSVTKTGAAPCTLGIGYDSLGNIRSRSDLGVYEYAGSGPHAPSGLGAERFEYDSLGRQTVRTDRGRQLYTSYNSWSKPQEVRVGDEGPMVAEYSYDATGERLVKRAADETVITIAGVYERHTGAAGDFERYLVTVGGRAVAVMRRQSGGGGEEIQYLHDDHLGSPVLLTGGSAGPERRQYDPWGHLVTPEPDGSEGPGLGFSGHQNENDVSLVDMGGRMYDPRLGRFTTPDPIVQDPFTSQSLDPYAYVRNNPLSLIDPSGYAPTGFVLTCQDFGCTVEWTSNPQGGGYLSFTENPSGDLDTLRGGGMTPGSFGVGSNGHAGLVGVPPYIGPGDGFSSGPTQLEQDISRGAEQIHNMLMGAIAWQAEIGASVERANSNLVAALSELTRMSESPTGGGGPSFGGFIGNNFQPFWPGIPFANDAVVTQTGWIMQWEHGVQSSLVQPDMFLPFAGAIVSVGRGLTTRALTALDIGLSGKGLANLAGSILDAGSTRIITVDMIAATGPGAIPAGELRSALSTMVNAARAEGVVTLQLQARFANGPLARLVAAETARLGGTFSSAEGTDLLTFVLRTP
jgi:RHS repeat-associated protein